MVVVHPNNPTGSYASENERSQLNSFCRERGLALIVDEVFLDYPHDGALRPSFVSNPDVLTFTLSGVSKISGLPQMKLAWVTVSGPLQIVNEAMGRLEVIADTYLSMNAPIQFAAATLLEQRKHVQPLILDRVRMNLAELDHQLAGQKASSAFAGRWGMVCSVARTRNPVRRRAGHRPASSCFCAGSSQPFL